MARTTWYSCRRLSILRLRVPAILLLVLLVLEMILSAIQHMVKVISQFSESCTAVNRCEKWMGRPPGI